MFSTRSFRSMPAALFLAAIAFATSPLHAEIVTGTIEERVAPMNGLFIRTIGDGVNSCQLWLNFGYYGPTNRALGFNGRYSGFTNPEPSDAQTDSEIAFVPNVLEPSQLGDVSQLTFTQFTLDEYVMAAAWSAAHPNPLVPTGLVVHRNVNTGHYAVVRLNDMWGFQNQAFQGSMANLTWWFQTDGTGDFSSVPGPACAPDVAGANQSIGPDGNLGADDIIVFLGWYFASDPRADVAASNQSTTPDGNFTADDIIVFLGRFFAGC